MENQQLIKKTSENTPEKKMKYSFKIMSNNKSQETNHISTAKYNFFNFIPKKLFEQFSKLINIYFLIISLFQVK